MPNHTVIRTYKYFLCLSLKGYSYELSCLEQKYVSMIVIMRRWPSIKTTSGQCSVISPIYCLPCRHCHSPNVVSMPTHRLGRWPNIETALGEFPFLLGLYLCGTYDYSHSEFKNKVMFLLREGSLIHPSIASLINVFIKLILFI